MSVIEIIEAPVIKPLIVIDNKTKIKLLKNIIEQSHVIVHCTCRGENRIRIWKSTYLFPKGSSQKCKLVHFENISLYPQWTDVSKGEEKHFTLIFKGLPKNCKFFDLVEVIPESGGWDVRSIVRNKSDVYFIDLS